jgi:hypothetical protein
MSTAKTSTAGATVGNSHVYKVGRFTVRSCSIPPSSRPAQSASLRSGGGRSVTCASTKKDENWHEAANEAAREEIVDLCMDALAEVCFSHLSL